ncbi:MAG: DUF3592 domain-containing protein [Chitinophagaceae bacterium]|nr:MAG: DUF3592 domain-containing protein [Chitinophagaceae bacterium]
MFYSISLIVGIILLAASLFLFRQSLAFIKQSERATATVIELESITDNDGTTFKPIFRFKTSLNQEVHYRHISSTAPPSWKIGETAIVAYDPGNPEACRLLTYFGVFNWTIILMAIAMPLLVIGGGYFMMQQLLK